MIIYLAKIKAALAGLEGCVEGIRPYHPRVARYMTMQIDTVYREWHIKNDMRMDVDDKNLSGKSKEGWEQIDRQALGQELFSPKTTDNTVPEVEVSTPDTINLEEFFEPVKRGRGRPRKSK